VLVLQESKHVAWHASDYVLFDVLCSTRSVPNIDRQLAFVTATNLGAASNCLKSGMHHRA
jgi:hypothetical protein